MTPEQKMAALAERLRMLPGLTREEAYNRDGRTLWQFTGAILSLLKFGAGDSIKKQDLVDAYERQVIDAETNAKK